MIPFVETGIAATPSIKTVDRVYHVTVADRANLIETEGLETKPNMAIFARDRRLRAKNILLDSVRPESVVQMGISRDTALYAHTHSEIVHGIYRQSASDTNIGSRHLANIEIDVDPDTALVCDAYLLSRLEGTETRAGEYRFNEFAAKYARAFWEESITLAQFREWYEVQVDESGLWVQLKEGAPEGLPPTFLQPEVMIPGPKISPDRLRWFSSSVFALPDYTNW